MESNEYSYQFSQNGNQYQFTIKIIGNSLRMSCLSLNNVSSKQSYRDLTLEQLKQISPIFSFIQTATQAFQYIDEALKKKKVGILEENNILKIVFYITSKGITHTIEIPLRSNYDSPLLDNNYIGNNPMGDDFLGQIKTLDSNTNVYESIMGQENMDNMDLNKYITQTTNTVDIDEYTKSDAHVDYQYMNNDNIIKTSIHSNNQYSDILAEMNNNTNNNSTIYQQINQNEGIYDNPPYISPVDESQNSKYIYTGKESNKVIEESNNINLDEYFNQANIQINEKKVKTEYFNADNKLNENFRATRVLPIQTTTKVLPLIGPFTSLNGLDLHNLANMNSQRQKDADYNYQEIPPSQVESGNYESYFTQQKNVVNYNEFNNKIMLKNEELNKLREENIFIKKQISELKANNFESEEMKSLKMKLQEFEEMRKIISEYEVLRGQVSELNKLREKLSEFNSLKEQVVEMNQLKAQFSQINLLKDQMEELNTLKLKAAEVDKLTLRIKELQELNMNLEEQIKSLKESQILYNTMKSNSSKKGTQEKYEDENEECMTVKGDIIQNSNELELLTKKINKSNRKLILNLLYKASADSDKAAAFHAKCDSAKSSIVLVETDKGKRFGGFTTCSWSGDCIDKRDENAFIFSFDKMMTYDNIPGEDAIGCYPKFGPIFLGCQIRIFDNAFTKGGTTFERGLSFNTQENYELTGGDRFFKVKEIEVYEVIQQ